MTIITKKILDRTIKYFDFARGPSSLHLSYNEKNQNMEKFKYNLKYKFNILFYDFSISILTKNTYYTNKIFKNTLNFLKQNSTIIDKETINGN